jgi:methylated-DNA-[protein]-cysteine S-methyltransferase
MTTYAATTASPIGTLTVLVGADGALKRILFAGEAVPASPDIQWSEEKCAPALAQLREYFAGARRSFDLPLAPEGTDFQRRVWSELARIPFGATIDYRSLAERVGRPGAARAVGRANATNPIPIVLPCHRVIGADGSLTGYAGGIETKRRLLRLEGAAA